jgi:hypothetical protein
MATRYLELPPDELDPTPGLVMIEADDERVAAIVKHFGATEITKERAIEVLALNHMGDGYGDEEARAMALEDMEEWEA